MFRGQFHVQVMMDRAALRLILLAIFLISATSDPVKKVRVKFLFKMKKTELKFLNILPNQCKTTDLYLCLRSRSRQTRYTSDLLNIHYCSEI